MQHFLLSSNLFMCHLPIGHRQLISFPLQIYYELPGLPQKKNMGDLVIAIDIFSTFALKRHKCSAHSVRMNEYRQTPTSFHVSALFFLMFHAQCRKSERQLARTLSPVTTLEWTMIAMRNFLATFIVKFISNFRLYLL